MAKPTKYARLKPHNPKRKHFLRSYHLSMASPEGNLLPGGVRFEVTRGWYPVTEEVAARLAEVHQVESDPDSPLAFDVVNTIEEARAIDAREKAERDRRAGIVAQNDLQSGDVAEGRRPAATVLAEAPAREPRIPEAQRGIRRGVRSPSERATRPADEHERERA